MFSITLDNLQNAYTIKFSRQICMEICKSLEVIYKSAHENKFRKQSLLELMSCN